MTYALNTDPAIAPPRYPAEVRAEAMRIADKTGACYEDLPRIEAAVAYKAFTGATEELRRMQARVYAVSPRTYVIDSGGALTSPPVVLPPESAEAARLLGELIAAEARRYGLVPQT